MLEGQELQELLARIPDDGMSDYARSRAIVAELTKSPSYSKTVLQMLTQFGWVTTDSDWRYMSDDDVCKFALEVWERLNIEILKKNNQLT